MATFGVAEPVGPKAGNLKYDNGFTVTYGKNVFRKKTTVTVNKSLASDTWPTGAPAGEEYVAENYEIRTSAQPPSPGKELIVVVPVSGGANLNMKAVDVRGFNDPNGWKPPQDLINFNDPNGWHPVDDDLNGLKGTVVVQTSVGVGTGSITAKAPQV